MDLNLKRFLAYYGKIILMPEILMGSNSCSFNFEAKRYISVASFTNNSWTITCKDKKHQDRITQWLLRS
jgi:hypothetical protein